MDKPVKKKEFTDFLFSYWLARFLARFLIVYHEDEEFREQLEDAIKTDLLNESGLDMFTWIALSGIADKYTEIKKHEEMDNEEKTITNKDKFEEVFGFEIPNDKPIMRYKDGIFSKTFHVDWWEQPYKKVRAQNEEMDWN